MNIASLEETELGKNLIDKDLNWSQKCRKSASKAMPVLGMMKMSFKQIGSDNFKIVSNTYIRRHVEFCVEVWNHNYKKDIGYLENRQKRATKLA